MIFLKKSRYALFFEISAGHERIEDEYTDDYIPLFSKSSKSTVLFHWIIWLKIYYLTLTIIVLFQIASETAAAQEISNKSVDDIQGLQDRLDKLKKKFTENEINAKKSAIEANIAGRLADQAEKVNKFEISLLYEKNNYDPLKFLVSKIF